jgi:NADPH:quinone reductase-like Zn-dependent oxidoreductase
MRAVGITSFGGPEVLTVVGRPEPTPGKGEVLVRVRAAAVNPTDVLLREGRQADRMTGLTAPYTPGMEFAGVVHSVGAGSVASDLAPGTPVMGLMDPRTAGGGAQAEWVVAPWAHVVPIDRKISFEHAATVPMSGLTALLAVRALNLPPAGTVLVTGAVGAVGSFVAQMADDEGLTVVADGYPDQEDLLRCSGATEVVARGPGLPSRVRAIHPEGVDGVVDTALIGQEAADCVRDDGVAVHLRRGMPQQAHVRTENVWVTDSYGDRELLSRLSDLLTRGVLRPRLGHSLGVDQVTEAYRLIATRRRTGRIVLTF